MDISLTIVRAIVYLVILCVQCFRLRRKNKNLKNRLPAKKAQDLPRAVVGGGGWWRGAVTTSQKRGTKHLGVCRLLKVLFAIFTNRSIQQQQKTATQHIHSTQQQPK
jgi:hypothetical protein